MINFMYNTVLSFAKLSRASCTAVDAQICAIQEDHGGLHSTYNPTYVEKWTIVGMFQHVFLASEQDEQA